MTKIDDLPDNLPRTEEKIRTAFEECLKEKRAIVKTRTYVKVPREFYRNYINSALTALNAAKILLENGSYEWAIVPAYSAMFQAGNAIVIKEHEKECRDHFCLLVTLLKLKKIGPGEAKDITSIKQRLDKLSEESIAFASKLRLVRSSVIYKPSEEYNEKEIAEEVFDKAKRFVNYVMGIVA
jgi:uncharacterized protein (UPF0332 family)